MPTITATPFNNSSYVRVDTDWSSDPEVQYARVVRVHADCTEYALRPHTAYIGDYMAVGCDGSQVWWDTEAPLDQQFSYRSEASALPDEPVLIPATAAVHASNASVTPTVPPQSRAGDLLLVLAAIRNSGTGVPDVPTGYTSLLLSGNVRVSGKVHDGSEPNPTQSFTGGVANATTSAQMCALRGVGTDVGTLGLVASNATLGASAQDMTVAALTLPDTSLVAVVRIGWKQDDFTNVATGDTRIGSAASTLGDDQGIAWSFALSEDTTSAALRTFTVFGGAAAINRTGTLAFTTDSAPAGATTGNFTMPSDGDFWLKDPVRPCHDQRVGLCFNPQPSCPPGTGLAFLGIDRLVYANNSTLAQPTNRRRPVAINRVRRDAESRLALITRSFTDRDRVLDLTDPGEPLLWQAPAGYGIPDRYMSVGDVTVEQPLPDTRYSPRGFTLPFVTVDRPAGPSQGTCETQYAAMCTQYATWDAMETATLTYENLIDGSVA